MSHHEDETRLRHMLDHAAEAIEMVRGRTRRDIDADRQLNLALVLLDVNYICAVTTITLVHGDG